ncbi:unnamed protein product [Caretta caretta]
MPVQLALVQQLPGSVIVKELATQGLSVEALILQQELHRHHLICFAGLGLYTFVTFLIDTTAWHPLLPPSPSQLKKNKQTLP